MRLFALLFALPVWILFVLAAGFGFAGYEARKDANALQAERAALAKAPQPEVQPISGYEPRPGKQRVVEAHVLARWAPEYNTQLFTTEKDGEETPDGTLILLMDENATTGNERQVAAVVVVPPKDHDRLVDWMIGNLTEEVMPHPLVRLEGLVGRQMESKHVEAVLKKHDLVKAPDFFWISPFLDGREAELAKAPWQTDFAPFHWAIAGIISLVGFGRLLARRFTAPSPTASEAARQPAAATSRPVGQPLAQVAGGAAPSASRPPTSQGANKQIALGIITLLAFGALIWSGWGMVILPLSFLFFALYGFNILRKKAVHYTFQALDRVTGAPSAQASAAMPVAAPGPAQFATGSGAPPGQPEPLLRRSYLQTPQAPAATAADFASSPIMSGSGKGDGAKRFAKRQTQWLPFLGGVALLVVAGFMANGVEGIGQHFRALLAPFNGPPAEMISITGKRDPAPASHLSAAGSPAKAPEPMPNPTPGALMQGPVAKAPGAQVSGSGYPSASAPVATTPTTSTSAATEPVTQPAVIAGADTEAVNPVPGPSSPAASPRRTMLIYGLMLGLAFVLAYGKHRMGQSRGHGHSDPWQRLDQRLNPGTGTARR